MSEEKYIKLKYNPTGNVFTLPEAEARRIYLEDKGFNYEVVEGKIEIEDEKTEETTVYNEIVEEIDNGAGEASDTSSNKPVETETTEESQGNDTKPGETEGEKTLEEYTVPELKAKLDAMNIQYPKSARKADLIALLKDEETETTEESQGE